MGLEACATFRAPSKFRRDRRSASWAIDLLCSRDWDRMRIGGLARSRQERGKHVEEMSAAHSISPQDSFWPQ